MIKDYLKNILKVYKKGDAREESYYPPLKEFIENLGEKFNKKTSVTVLPKNIAINNFYFNIIIKE